MTLPAAADSKMNRRILTLLLLAALTAGGIISWLKLQPGKNTAPFPIHIAFTSDTSGRIEPCGCFTGQYGGLTRVSTHLGPSDGKRLLYEIGDALAGSEDFHIVHYDYLLRAYGEIGYAAVNLGHREAQLSSEALRTAAENSPVPLISANLLDASTHEPVVKPWIVTELKNESSTLRVATIGVVDPNRMKGKPGDGIQIARMDEVLRRHLPDMKKEADLIVCLAFTDEAGIHQLAEEFYEFTFILGGDVRQPSQNIKKINRTWTLSTTNQARALGELAATWKPDTGHVGDVTGNVTLMVEAIPQDAVVKAHSEQYRKDIRNTKLAIDIPGGDASQLVPGVKPSATYVGSQSCATCHKESYDVWQKSRHAHAFDALLYTKSDADPSCIKCHTVGFGEPGGYLRSMGKEKLVNVSCESCHGPGSEHVRLRSTASPGEEITLKLRAVGAGQCIQCHHGEFSRPFDWDEFWPLIKHGKEK